MANNYAAAMDVITDEAMNFKALVIEIAKHHPAAVLFAHGTLKGPSWQMEAEELIRADKFIDAIRLCRVRTGSGLKEAKDACDVIKARVGKGT